MTILLIRIMLLGGLCLGAAACDAAQPIPLPRPAMSGEMSLEHAIAARRTVRRFADTPITLADLGQLLWAAQGITDAAGYRAAPSAGALYPLEVFVIVGNAADLASGVYAYDPTEHALMQRLPGDQRKLIASAALDQTWIAEAPVVLAITGVRERTAAKYGPRSNRYIAMEAGHVAQNVSLQCVARHFATAVVGGFRDESVRDVLNLSRDHTPLVLMPIGRVHRD